VWTAQGTVALRIFCPTPDTTTAAHIHGHLPTTRHRNAPDTDPIEVHIFVWYEAPFVFHMNHSDKCCTPPPLRIAMGRPPTTRHRYAPGTDPLEVHIFVWYEAPFVFHMDHSDDFCTTPPLRTAMGHPPATCQRYAPDGH
jgi:hypothetical protein